MPTTLYEKTFNPYISTLEKYVSRLESLLTAKGATKLIEFILKVRDRTYTEDYQTQTVFRDNEWTVLATPQLFQEVSVRIVSKESIDGHRFSDIEINVLLLPMLKRVIKSEFKSKMENKL